ncbi:nucleotidyl transferase AbiEii/AbiGii toxin family protein [Kribbella sp. NPDC003505]|uniref:nucleotidyl transferase AbiEii/AbiGii toxin family protein n=1 Tax=Kribbella sp. NPDC003505 TaxID=3154448 RepID=UPI0033B91C35
MAASDLRDSFVLRGGVLLAAFDTRRPTKDVDLAGIKVVNSTEMVLDLVQTVLRVPVVDDDGIEFFPETATAGVIRDEEQYSGVPEVPSKTGSASRLPSSTEGSPSPEPMRQDRSDNAAILHRQPPTLIPSGRTRRAITPADRRSVRRLVASVRSPVPGTVQARRQSLT